MKVVITGGAGFLGKKLARRILQQRALAGPDGRPEKVSELLLFDVGKAEGAELDDARVKAVAGDIANKDTVQKVVNAFVKTLKWINSHSAEEIADKMPKDYYAGDRALYVQGLKEGKPQYSPDGMMPQGAPESVNKILASFSPNVQGKTIDLSKTYTTEFVVKANAGQ